jgi:hypothetical protein
MATITAITSSGTPLNVLSTSTWVGGVVPGPADTAVFPPQTIRSTFTLNSTNGYLAQAPWNGYITLNVSTTTGFPGTGSFYVFPAPIRDQLLPVKIDYVGITGTSFLSCSVDYAFRDWKYINSHSYTETFPGDNIAIGDLQYNDYIYRGFTGSIAATNPFNWQNQYELTGSGIWEVGKVNLNYATDFTVKDSATLIMNNTTTTTTCFVGPVVSPMHGGFRALDQCTLKLTGSYDNRATNVVNGIGMSTVGNSYVIISGSSNYSSSILASSSLAESTTLTLQNATSFGLGDYITVQSIPNSTRYAFILSGSNPLNVSGSLSKYGTPFGDQSYPAGGYYGAVTFAAYDTASYETDDVVQIESISGSTVTVSKRFGRQGEIQQDMGLYTHREFTETYKSSPEPFINSMRAVLVDSNHRSYQPGDQLIISGSVYRVHHATTYLSQSKFIDFTNPTTKWTDYIGFNEYMYSGSGYTMGAAGFNPQYRKWTLLTTASRAGVSSLYINSASCTTPSNPNGNEASIFAPLINTYFTEGEITLSGSIMRNFTTADTANQTALGVFCGTNPYMRTYGVYTNCNSILTGPQTPDLMSGIAVNDSAAFVRNYCVPYGNVIMWPQTASLDPNESSLDLPITPFTGSGQSVSLKLVREKGIQKYYLQDVLIDENLSPLVERGLVTIALQRFASIFTVDIKERYQLLLLDTQQSFTYRDFIKEGGLLDYQSAGKICKFVANEIEDPIGMRNLLWDYYYKKGQTNRLPYCHSFIQTTAGNVDTGILNTAFASKPLTWQTGPSAYSTNALFKTGASFFITYDLGESINFDTVGVGFVKDGQMSELDVNNQINNVQIDVSDDLVSWTTVRASATDTRLATGGNAIRFYTFPSGSVTKRFVKFYSAGGSAAIAYNNQGFFGVYNFATGSGGAYPSNTTNQIKLRSAKNFEIGDQIMFWNKDAEGKRQDGGQFTNIAYARSIAYDSITNITTTATDSTVAGGLTDYYTITAKSGSVITLDRTPAYDHLFERTVVLKLNRGKINITSGRLNRYTIFQAGSLNTMHIEHVNHYSTGNATYFGVHRSPDAAYVPHRGVLEDCFLYQPVRNRSTHAAAGMRERNVIGKVQNYGAGVIATYYSAYTSVIFNNFMYGPTTNIQFPTDHVDRHIVNNNVFLQATTYPAARTTFASIGPWENRGKIYIKNNYFNMANSSDPRAFGIPYVPTYLIDQIYKLSTWQNNYFSGVIALSGNISGYLGLSTSPFGKLTDYRYRNSMVHTDARLQSGYLSNQGIPYSYNGTNQIDPRGYLETVMIREGKSECIRMTTRVTK